MGPAEQGRPQLCPLRLGNLPGPHSYPKFRDNHVKCWYLRASPDNVASLPRPTLYGRGKGPSILDVDMNEKGSSPGPSLRGKGADRGGEPPGGSGQKEVDLQEAGTWPWSRKRGQH